MPRRFSRPDVELQREWNALVPLAIRHGIRGVRMWGDIPAAGYGPQRQQRINQLRQQLALRGADIPDDLQVRYTVPVTSTAPRALAIAFAEVESELLTYTFGVEIECMLPSNEDRYSIARRITESGVDCRAEHLSHTTRTWWKATHDGSLRSSRGCEFVSPILSGQAGFDEMRKMCKLIEDAGCTINRRCGMHVHVGVRGNEWCNAGFFRNILRTYAHFEPAIDTIVARSRRGPFGGDGFCRTTAGKLHSMDYRHPGQTLNERIAGIEDVDTLLRTYAPNPEYRDRYEKLNIASYWRHGTIEFRQHQGTVRIDRIEPWVKLCLRMVHSVVNGFVPTPVEAGETVNLQGLATALNMTAGELAFYERRAVQLDRTRQERR